MGDPEIKGGLSVNVCIQKSLWAIALSIYLLGSHKGYLALWKDDRPEPFQIYPVKVSALPEEDRLALEKGIAARSEIELSSLLEDFLS